MSGEWQTIDTAPSDGRLVLVCGGSHTDATVVRGADGDWWRYARKDGMRSIPTHWMPMPEPYRSVTEVLPEAQKAL
jgi:hypothetical protein